MCGICGELRFDDKSATKEFISGMLPALKQRGPDDNGIFLTKNIALGHTRLKIIDLSDNSRQPMVDNNLVIVFNGAIYNYREIRHELENKGHKFFSDGDTEVILKSFKQWGEGCTKRFNGMFAFAIWDKEKKSLFLARDRFGIKPLYYMKTTNSFIFASNTKALLAKKNLDKKINPIGLHFQFSLHGVIPAPDTIIKNINKLPPSHQMTISKEKKIEITNYWNLDNKIIEQNVSAIDWKDNIRDSIIQSIRKRNFASDVPVGLLLSGGLDSSLLAALSAEAGIEELITFSVGFEDYPEEKGSEFEFSDQIVKKFKTKHHKFLISNDEVLSRLPEAVDAMSEPMFGQDSIAFFLLSEKVAQKIKVVQSGQGADEVFGGYFWYLKMMEEKNGTRLDRFKKYYFDREHSELGEMFERKYINENYTAEFIENKLENSDSREFIDSVLQLDVTTLIVDDPIKRVDNMTMAFGLEARMPYMDYELVELAMSCPNEIKIGKSGKAILKQIARGLLPDSVIDRPKGYFPVPALKYVRGNFLEFMRDVINSEACKNRGLFRRRYLDMLLDAPELHHTRIMGSKLWQVALLEFWFQRNIDPI
tara:strand:- start:477 stop:2252 length:1776 start_codon:yes stop_codon:yes gene_type:complete